MPTNPTDLAHRMNPGFQVGQHSFTPARRPLSPIERMIDQVTGFDPSRAIPLPEQTKAENEKMSRAMLELCSAACIWNRKYKSEPHRKAAEAKLRKAVDAYRALGGW